MKIIGEMGNNGKTTGISKDLYFFYLDVGVPYEGYVEGLGYALQEVEIIGVKINKYNDKFLKTSSVPICVVDNTYNTTTQKNETKTREIEDTINRERKKKEAKENFKIQLKKFYAILMVEHVNEKTKYEADLGFCLNKIENDMLCMADIPGILQDTKECKEYFQYYKNISYYNSNYDEIKEYVPNIFEKINESGFIGRFLYDVVDALCITGQVVLLQIERRHLDGSSVVGEEHFEAGFGTLTTLVPFGKLGTKVGIASKTLNMGQFNKLMKNAFTRPISGKLKKQMLNEHNQIIIENNLLKKDIRLIENVQNALDISSKINSDK
jgi:hypothetical protein